VFFSGRVLFRSSLFRSSLFRSSLFRSSLFRSSLFRSSLFRSSLFPAKPFPATQADGFGSPQKTLLPRLDGEKRTNRASLERLPKRPSSPNVERANANAVSNETTPPSETWPKRREAGFARPLLGRRPPKASRRRLNESVNIRPVSKSRRQLSRERSSQQNASPEPSASASKKERRPIRTVKIPRDRRRQNRRFARPTFAALVQTRRDRCSAR